MELRRAVLHIQLSTVNRGKLAELKTLAGE